MWSGLVWFGLVWSGLVWLGLVWSGLVWSGLVWSVLVWSGLVWSGLEADLSVEEHKDGDATTNANGVIAHDERPASPIYLGADIYELVHAFACSSSASSLQKG